MKKENKQGLVIAVGGLSGSGKSTLASRLFNDVAKKHDAEWICTDKVRKELWGVAETVKLPEKGYSKEFSAAVYNEVSRRTYKAAAQGKIVFVDAVYATPSGRNYVEATARKAKAAFVGLWLDAPVKMLKARADARKNDASDADSKVVEMQAAFNLGQISWHRLDASGSRGAVYRQAKSVLKRLGVLFDVKPLEANQEHPPPRLK